MANHCTIIRRTIHPIENVRCSKRLLQRRSRLECSNNFAVQNNYYTNDSIYAHRFPPVLPQTAAPDVPTRCARGTPTPCGRLTARVRTCEILNPPNGNPIMLVGKRSPTLADVQKRLTLLERINGLRSVEPGGRLTGSASGCCGTTPLRLIATHICTLVLAGVKSKTGQSGMVREHFGKGSGISFPTGHFPGTDVGSSAYTEHS
jgi:hypothetical protein